MSKFNLEIVKNDYLSFNFKTIEKVFPNFNKELNYRVSEDRYIIELEWQESYYNILAYTDLYKPDKCRKTTVFFFYKSVDYEEFNHNLSSYDQFKCDNPIKVTREEICNERKLLEYVNYCVSTFYNSDALEQYKAILYWHQCLTICKKLQTTQSTLQTTSLQAVIDSNLPIPYKQMCAMNYVNLQKTFIHTVVFIKHSDYETGRIQEWKRFHSIEDFDGFYQVKSKIVKNKYRSILDEPDYAHYIYKIKTSFLNTVDFNYFIYRNLMSFDYASFEDGRIYIFNEHKIVYSFLEKYMNCNLFYHFNN